MKILNNLDNLDRIPDGATRKLADKEVTTNKVTSISASSTDTQYPSAKAVNTLVNNNKTTITIREW